MELTSQDVRARRFAVTRWRRGYERADVDALLARAAAALDELEAGAHTEPPAHRRGGAVDHLRDGRAA